MKKELREKERQLFKSSYELRKLDLSKVEWDQAMKIRKKQSDDYNKMLFYKGYLAQLEKENKKNE